MTGESEAREWTTDELDALRRAFGLGLTSQTLEDALLTPDEKRALHEHLAMMANLRRRVDAEARGKAMP